MAILTDRASIKRAFHRLCGTSDTNPALIEHDSSSLETLYQYLQYGAWDAQAYLIDAGQADRWVTTSSALSFSDDASGAKFAALPSDFLRAAGDDERSCLRLPNQYLWGRQVDFRDRWFVTGAYYWLQDNTNVWLARLASPPAGLVIDYHEKLSTLADSTTVDFPEEHRSLIPAFAAMRAMNDAWLPGDMEMKAAIAANLQANKREVHRRARRTSGPRKIKNPRSVGSHWF